MTDLLIEHDPNREQECHGINSYHPMILDDVDPFAVFTGIAAVLLVIDGLFWLIHSMFS